MNCSELADRLYRLQHGSLTPEDRDAAEEHLADCASCRELLRLTSGISDISILNPPQGLAEAILERTSGAACRRAHEHLCDFVDGNLPDGYRDLLILHLDNCADCSSLCRSLSELKEALPQMGAIEPGMDFTFRVLRATSRMLPEPRLNPWARARQWWLRLIQRPRFSWEAAYLGTVLLVSMFGNPLTAIHDLSLQAVKIYRSGASVSPVAIGLPGSLVRSESGVLRGVKDAMGFIALRQHQLSEFAAGAFERGVQSSQIKAQSELQAVHSLGGKALSAVRLGWVKLFHPAPNRSSSQSPTKKEGT